VSFHSGTEAVAFADPDTASAISRELHQATQPITVLLGTLELALMTASTVDEYRHAIELSLKQLHRVTDCFEHLRALIQLQSASDVAANVPGKVEHRKGPAS
jgi:hypothetical protein